jgi:hypothetical protein
LRSKPNDVDATPKATHDHFDARDSNASPKKSDISFDDVSFTDIW